MPKRNSLCASGRFHRVRLTHLCKSTRCAPPNALRVLPFPASVVITDAGNEPWLSRVCRPPCHQTLATQDVLS